VLLADRLGPGFNWLVVSCAAHGCLSSGCSAPPAAERESVGRRPAKPTYGILEERRSLPSADIQGASKRLKQNDLTDAERELFDRLPGPPTLAEIRTTNIWIVEWLSPNEQLTGRLLHDWIKDRRPGWSAYFPCRNKVQVIQAIERATSRAEQSQMIPVLHVESHGDHVGLEGPDGLGSSELLAWDELTEPLQLLNLATRCNLVVVVAACIGFAGIRALRQGPRAPAVALVGPDAPVSAGSLLWGTKEFYRRLMDNTSRLAEIVASASREVEPVAFDWAPFAILAYDALIELLITSIRPAECVRRKERFRLQMRAYSRLSASEIESRLADLPPLPSPVELQQMWDTMFMIDRYPENRERFGVDMESIVELIMKGHDL
jgi:hypothetical protein